MDIAPKLAYAFDRPRSIHAATTRGSLPCVRRPNERHRAHLLELSSRYASTLGVGVLVLPYAAASSDSVATMGTKAVNVGCESNTSGTAHGFGADGKPCDLEGSSSISALRVQADARLSRQVRVRTVDLARIVRHVHALLVQEHARQMHKEVGLRARPRIVAKLDVEGVEYELIPHMAYAGAWCLLDTVAMEWHGVFKRFGRVDKGGQEATKLVHLASHNSNSSSAGARLIGRLWLSVYEAMTLLRSQDCTADSSARGTPSAPPLDCATCVISLDDESYNKPIPWPQATAGRRCPAVHERA
jgi:hypothetical protein